MPETSRKLHVNKIAIVGNPNVGKSALFNQITRSYSLEANAPHTTVSVQRAPVTIEGVRYEMIDTPGMLSLDVQSEDGLVTRRILLEEHPEAILFCVDSNNLERSFFLMAQVLALDIPMVICLNFMDESLLKGLVIDRKKLEITLALPVVETVASEGRGIGELIRAIGRAGAPGHSRVRYRPQIEAGLDRISSCFPPETAPSDAVLLLLLIGDPRIESFVQKKYGDPILEKVHTAIAGIRHRSARTITRIILDDQHQWAARTAAAVTETRSAERSRAGETLASLSRHPVFGWVLLFAVVYGTYLLVGKLAVEILVPFCEEQLFLPILKAVESFVPWALARDFLVGDYGILTTGLFNALGTALPILSMFFMILNLLEDTGYIPNLCILTNRFFQRLGMSGKALLPVMLGFGCKTMATLTTRILESRKERTIAIFLIAFAIPCAPLLGVTLAILALYPFAAFLAVFGTLIGVEIAAGLVLNKITRADVPSDFIMEIPPMRLPSLKNLLTKTYYRLKWFTIEAVPLFMLGALALFVLEKCRVLAFVKQAVLPIFVSYLNLPLSTVDAFLLCLLRKEAGAIMFLHLAKSGRLDFIQAVVGMVLVNCFIPCFANIMAIIKQLGLRAALVMTLVISLFSAMIGIVINHLLRIF